MWVASSTSIALAPRKAILVIDPDRKVKDQMNCLVILEGWNLEQASDNESALSAATTKAFDLIITGQETSCREDLELLRKLRSVRPHVRMIILTDANTPDDIIACLRENAFSYFAGPFHAAQLAEIVHMAMSEPCWDDGIEVISATPQWIRLLARCTRETADRLIHFLRQANLPPIERDELAVAAHEILLNAMEHGGGFDPSQYVEIGYLRTKRIVACRVRDPGKGFCLDELHHAAINNPDGDLFSHLDVRSKKGIRPGGFGLLLAKNHVDDVIYGEHGNDVILIKHLDQPSLASDTLSSS